MDGFFDTLKGLVDTSSWQIEAVDIGVMIGYLVLMIVVGLLCKSISKDISDYVRMGCKSTWWLMGTSIFMLMTSASSLTGGPAQAYMSGWSFLIMGLGGFLGWLCMAGFFAPWMRRTRAVTPADALRLRYGPFIEQINAYVGAIGGMLWGGVWLYSFALFMAVIFNVPTATVIIFVGIIVVFYSVSGGSWSVQITDTLQGYILVPIVFVVFILSMNEVGWFPGLIEAINSRPELAEDYKIIMDSGHEYSSPVGRVGGDYFTWWWLIASFIYSFALSANVTSCWRFLSCKTDKDARKAALLAGCLLFFGAAVWYLPAMVARVKYEDDVIALRDPAKLLSVKDSTEDMSKAVEKIEDSRATPAIVAGAVKDAELRAALDPRIKDADKRIRAKERLDLKHALEDHWGIKKHPKKLYLSNPAEGAYAIVAKKLLPPGLIGLVVIALLAATMSSLDSSLTGNAGIVCNNIYPALMRLFKKEPWTGKKLLRFTQLVNFLLGIWAIILAFLIMKGAESSGIYQISLQIILLVSLPMVLSMVLSFFVRWLPFWAPLVGMCFGFFGSASFMFSGPIASWAGNVSWMPELLKTGLNNYAAWLASLMWHEKIYINLGLTVVPTFMTAAWWHKASPEYRARVDNFFKQIHTPIDFKKEVGESADHSLMKMIGTLGLVMAGAIAILVFFAEDWAGRFSVLFIVGFIAAISTLMLILGIRSQRKIDAAGGDTSAG